jgi:hypothetical protein
VAVAVVAVLAVTSRVAVEVAVVVVMAVGNELASGVPSFRFSAHVKGRAGRRSLVPGRRSVVQSLAMAMPKFKYVLKREAGNASRMSPGFYMRCRGKFAGPFCTQEEAAAEAAKILKVPTHTLERKPANQAPRPPWSVQGVERDDRGSGFPN